MSTCYLDWQRATLRVRFLIIVVAGVCTLSACSLLFESSSDVQNTDAGLMRDAADAAESAPDARIGELAAPRVVETKSDSFFEGSNSLYTLNFSGVLANRHFVVFVVTQGSAPLSVVVGGVTAQLLATNPNKWSTSSPRIHVYLAKPPAGNVAINVAFQSPLHTVIAAVQLEGVVSSEGATLSPSNNGSSVPSLQAPILGHQVLLYSVGCSATVGWQEFEPRRLWENAVDGIFSTTGLTALTDEPLDPKLSSVGQCKNAAAAGAILSGSPP